AEAHARLCAGEPPEALPLARTMRARHFQASVMERLGSRDFAAMSLEELAQVREALAGFELVLPEIAVRRTVPAARGTRPDLRSTLRAAARSGGEVVHWMRRAPRRCRPPLVLLCDISGSMSRYTRVLLQFAHALVNDQPRVHAFVFGTRLTDITRDLRRRDVDAALERVGRSAPDWSGGTRIAAALEAFNRLWSRRVLGGGAMVLLITDGLEREPGADLAAHVERLQRSCRRLVWLNPLLRFEGFEPRAAGVRAILPHVDEFLPVHNLHSLAALARALGSHAFQNTRSPRSKTPWT
ncbi:MAG: vWA domain-containing protein, partial [Betaproteobacteria bacterium]